MREQMTRKGGNQMIQNVSWGLMKNDNKNQ